MQHITEIEEHAVVYPHNNQNMQQVQIEPVQIEQVEHIEQVQIEPVQIEQVEHIEQVQVEQVQSPSLVFRVPCFIIKCLMNVILVLYWIAKTLLWLHFVAQLTHLSIFIFYRNVKHIFGTKMVSLTFYVYFLL
jgi:hypothetical protein